ncbi:hypothetical protein DFH06DRAFT_1133831 [Mycena polygramma]|nr:hypothetical protein DFH06DRAFT_1133831 [Mycena polygramma]
MAMMFFVACLGLSPFSGNLSLEWSEHVSSQQTGFADRASHFSNLPSTRSNILGSLGCRGLKGEAQQSGAEWNQQKVMRSFTIDAPKKSRIEYANHLRAVQDRPLRSKEDDLRFAKSTPSHPPVLKYGGLLLFSNPQLLPGCSEKPPDAEAAAEPPEPSAFAADWYSP